MPKIKKSIKIQASPEKVFAYIDQPDKTADWVASLVEVRDVSGTGVGQHYRWTYRMAGIPFDGETTVTDHVPNERRVVKHKGGIESTWAAILEAHDDGTELTLDVDYTVPVPVLGKLAEKLVLKRNERELELSLANLKDTLEA